MELVNISKIIVSSRTRNRIDPLKKGNLKKSIQKYGQLKPIVVDSSYNLIEGHNLYDILLDLNIEKVWIVKPLEETYKDQLYCELNLLQSDPQPIEYFECFKNSSEDNCIPLDNVDIKKFIGLLNFSPESYKEDRKSPKVEYIF